MTTTTIKIETVTAAKTRTFQQTFEDLDVEALVIALNQGKFSRHKAMAAPMSAEPQHESSNPHCGCSFCYGRRGDFSFPRQSGQMVQPLGLTGNPGCCGGSSDPVTP